MPPKKKGGKGKSKKSGAGKKGGKKPKPIIDWAADPHFDEKRAMIYIEHTDECPIFLEKALEFEKYLNEKYPDKMFQLVLNDNDKIQAREGAFEIGFSKTARTECVTLWSGIDKGPPRREKFPTSYEILLPEVDRILKKIYVEAKEDMSEWGEDEQRDELEGETRIGDS